MGNRSKKENGRLISREGERKEKIRRKSGEFTERSADRSQAKALIVGKTVMRE